MDEHTSASGAAAPSHRLPRGARPGRWISTSGLIGLAVAFFLPQVHGCRTDVVPFNEVFGAGERQGVSTLAFLPFFFAFAMLALCLLRAMLRSALAERVLSHLACVVTMGPCLVGAGVSALFLSDAIASQHLPGLIRGSSFAAGAAVGTGLMLWIWFKGLPRARMSACVSLGGFGSLGYFAQFLDMALYGLWVSLVSCALMGLGGFVEAEALWDLS